jgi:hypothetical protein
VAGPLEIILWNDLLVLGKIPNHFPCRAWDVPITGCIIIIIIIIKVGMFVSDRMLWPAHLDMICLGQLTFSATILLPLGPPHARKHDVSSRTAARVPTIAVS